MRTSHRCPKCSNTELLHVKQVADHATEAYTHHDDREPRMGAVDEDSTTRFRIARVQRPGRRGSVSYGSAGRVEAWICCACGLTELYTVDVDKIPIDGDFVVAVSGAAGTPYRS
jgi:predicted nucleic-acid-binding Zn-ribbon protein